jgi:hypothetical protein
VRRFTYVLLILGVFALGACGQGEIATEPAPQTEAVSPLPTATTEANLEPTAAAATPNTPPNLTPKPDLGLVQGTLSMDGELAPNETLYLASVVATGESMSVAGLDTDRDPRATTDETGTFTFVDVPPGQYALAVMSPFGPVVINGPDGQEIVVDVQGGELIELGEIDIAPFP